MEINVYYTENDEIPKPDIDIDVPSTNPPILTDSAKPPSIGKPLTETVKIRRR